MINYTGLPFADFPIFATVPKHFLGLIDICLIVQCPIFDRTVFGQVQTHVGDVQISPQWMYHGPKNDPQDFHNIQRIFTPTCWIWTGPLC